jgi:L-lactate dehydrogenase (cytochrome)
MNHQPQKQPKSTKLSGKEVLKHDNKDDCWVIIHGRAYDVTEFLPEHPGIFDSY